MISISYFSIAAYYRRENTDSDNFNSFINSVGFPSLLCSDSPYLFIQSLTYVLCLSSFRPPGSMDLICTVECEEKKLPSVYFFDF